MIVFYSVPCQVIFLREMGGFPQLYKGVAYKESIVDCERGDAVSTEYVMACARKWSIDLDYAIVEDFEWKPLNN